MTNFEAKLHFGAGLHGERNLKLPHGFEKSNDFSKVKGKKRENELPIGAFFSLGSYRGYSLQMFTFVIGISCGNTPFVQKHESTTHVNGFVFDSIFSVGKYFVRMYDEFTT